MRLKLEPGRGRAARLLGLAGNSLRTVVENTRLIVLAATQETTSSLLRLRHERVTSF